MIIVGKIPTRICKKERKEKMEGKKLARFICCFAVGSILTLSLSNVIKEWAG